jgi:hypothetical protein
MREHTERTRQTYLSVRDNESEPQPEVLQLATRRRRAPSL